MMRAAGRGRHDRTDGGDWQVSQSPASAYLLRIFSTMAVVELFSTRPSTRTSPP
jgi:hypothetical protein